MSKKYIMSDPRDLVMATTASQECRQFGERLLRRSGLRCFCGADNMYEKHSHAFTVWGWSYFLGVYELGLIVVGFRDNAEKVAAETFPNDDIELVKFGMHIEPKVKKTEARV